MSKIKRLASVFGTVVLAQGLSVTTIGCSIGAYALLRMFNMDKKTSVKAGLYTYTVIVVSNAASYTAAASWLDHLEDDELIEAVIKQISGE